MAVGMKASVDKRIKHGTSWIDEVKEEEGIKDEFKVPCLDDYKSMLVLLTFPA